MEATPLNIGWYCPFTPPVLMKDRSVMPVRIRFAACRNGRLGNLKLCKKMTAMQDMVRLNCLDGLVMADCCNLSHWMHDYFSGEDTNVPVFKMVVYRKTGALFTEKLLKEWESLGGWLESLKSQRAGLKARNVATDIRAAGTTPHIDDISRDTLPGTVWCTLPDAIMDEIEHRPLVETAEILLNNTFCLHMMDYEHLPPEKYELFAASVSPDAIDTECLLQNYLLFTLGEKRGKYIEQKSALS